MALFRLTEKTFIEPEIFEAGSVIDYEGPPGPHMVPLDEAAKASYQTWAEKNPHALINPVAALSLRMDGGAVVPGVNVPARAGLVSGPPRVTDFSGGLPVKVPESAGPVVTQELLQALAAQGIRPQGGSASIIIPDGENTGSNGESLPHSNPDKPGNPANRLSDNLNIPVGGALPGDASNPGAGPKDQETKEAAAEANAAGAEKTTPKK